MENITISEGRRLDRVEDQIKDHEQRLGYLDQQHNDMIKRLDRLFVSIIGFGGLITAALMTMVVTLWAAR